MTTADHLFALLPAHLRQRDEGLLRALLTAVAHEASVLDRDVRDLYDDVFVETAAEWALPYLADLYGIDDLPEGPGRRAFIANTIEYRRRKGTLTAAEQLVRDVRSAPAKAVESFRRLAVATHVNHVRIDRPATADIRRADERTSPAMAGGALDLTPRAAEVRTAVSGRGRYGIGSVLVFSYDTAVHSVHDAPATPDGDWWWTHPLARPRPLFASPQVETDIEHLADEPDLAVPLRPRRLLALLRQARTNPSAEAQLPVRITVDGAVLPASRVRVAFLEDLTDAGQAPVAADWHAMVDAVDGRIALYRGGVRLAAADPALPTVLVDYSFGARPGAGAGPYDRATRHEAALRSDGYVRRAGTPEVAAQRAVLLNDGDDLSAALAETAAGWTGAGSALGTTSVVSLGDSGTWRGSPAVVIPAATRLVLVAAYWDPVEAPRGALLPPVPGIYAAESLNPVVVGDVSVTVGGESSLHLDGITIVGDLHVTANGMLALTVSQATVTGTITVTHGTDGGAARLTVRVIDSLIGAVTADAGVPAIEVSGSVVSAEVGGGAPATHPGFAIDARGADLRIDGSTVRGDIFVRTMSCTDGLLDGTVTVRHRQVGCVRFSYLGPGSLTPRRFRCIPGSEADDDPRRPAYLSVEPGDPGFLRLAPSAPSGLLAGSETGDEIGVDAQLRRTTTLMASRRLVAAHLPAGTDPFVRSAR